MKSFTSALLGATALSQVASALSIGHRHAHTHTHIAKREDKDFVQFMSPDDVTYLKSKGIKTGKNFPCSSGEAVAVGVDGDFIVELNNKAAHDIIVVAWSGVGQWGAVSAGFVGAVQPDVTHTLKSNTTTWISYTPSKYNGGNDISGGLAPIYPGGGLTSFSGQVDNTWLEFTFTKDNAFSTTDVSRLINMNGNKIEAHNYKTKKDRDDDAVQPSCTTNNEKCAFLCSGSDSHCMWGALTGCPAGQAGTTSSTDGKEGGCGGLGTSSGYTEVNFY